MKIKSTKEIEQLQSELDALFTDLNEHNLDKSRSYARIRCIDAVYRAYTKQQASNRAGDKPGISFYDGVNTGLGNDYNLNMLLQDFNYVIKNESILIEAEKKLETKDHDHDGAICSAMTCISITRNYRERNEGGQAGADAFNQLYGVNYNDNNNGDDRESVLNEVNISDIMDTIHIELFHTIRIVPSEIREKEEELKMKQDEDKVVSDDEDGLYDIYCDAISSIIRVKSKSSRFNRGDGNRYGQGSNNKFMTVANQESIGVNKNIDDEIESEENKIALAIYQENVYGNETLKLQQEQEEKKEDKAHVPNFDNDTMLDAVYEEVNCELRGTDIEDDSDQSLHSLFKTFIGFLIDEEYDSDSFCIDFKDDDAGVVSNIISHLQGKCSGNSAIKSVIDVVSSVCKSMAYNVNIFSYEYQPGFRYFYWDFYKHLDVRENRVFHGSSGWTCESNPGYTISEWYIQPTWSNLKDEAINNTIAPYTIKEFETTMNKARIKLNAYQTDPNHKPLKCVKTYWNKLYGIAKGDTPTTEHICSLIMYTNFTKNCTSFSSTYRRRTGYETDRKLKERHSQVAHQGRLLRELIEGYGQSMEDPDYKHIDTFYHGINKAMIFKSTTIRLCGPVSTSTGLFYNT